MTSTKAGTDRGYPGLRKMKTTRDSQPVQNSDDGCLCDRNDQQRSNHVCLQHLVPACLRQLCDGGAHPLVVTVINTAHSSTEHTLPHGQRCKQNMVTFSHVHTPEIKH